MVVDGANVLAGPFDCLGKSDNQAAKQRGNPTRNPLFSYGDTPTGDYRGYVNHLEPTQTNDNTYGPNGIISLDPQSGDALKAKKNGRFGLLIHGGRLRDSIHLRPTFGCVRVSDESMRKILQAIWPKTEVSVTIKEV